MRSVVIDANVFHAFAQEEVLKIVSSERTASPLPLFRCLGTKCVAFLDSGGHIQAEWSSLTRFATEWFTNWLAEGFANGLIYEVDVPADPQLLRRYKKLGFPTGKDIWYIKTAYSLATTCRRSRPFLVAEDVDFYDPKLKAASNKADIFRNGRGPVSKQLGSDGIDLRCIAIIQVELGL